MKVYWGLAAVVTAAIMYVGVVWYRPLLTALHVLVALILLPVVLLQSGRAADLAGAFGGAGSQTAFGPRGAATLLSNATTFLAVVFMVTSLTLAIFSSAPGSRSILNEPAAPAPTEQQQQQPAEPTTPPAGQPPAEGSQQQPPAETPPPPQQ